ncbi:substrate-binding periplasmic protein [Rheinheimera sp. SA_1]|uniref:substrate-binding periplasmic protein n=1 Tax=Rheinheimera sp. SA_1 TaxID=1827365 RepID=UPI000B2A46DE|nr:transporter substrate-binding domain-containing protein [Rheinheimera sp. SA_1]
MAAVFLSSIRLSHRLLKFVGSLLLLSHFSLAASDVPVLEWCLDHYPNRHAYPKNAEPYGPTVDLMRELAVRSGFVLKFSLDTPFARCLKQMASGKTDLMINLNHSEQRATYMYLLPYSKGQPEVLYLHPKHQAINHFLQLQNKAVALVRGYVYADSLLQSIHQQQLTVHEADTLDNAFGLLLLNRVDAVVAPQQQALHVIASHPQYQQQFRVIALDSALVTELYAHLGFSKKSAYPQLLPAISKTLQQLVAEGKIPRNHVEADGEGSLNKPERARQLD